MEQHRAPQNATAMVKEALTRRLGRTIGMPLIARQGAVVRDAVNRVRNQPDFARVQVCGMVSGKGDCQIITNGASYQIPDARPCARPRVVGGFGTKAEARTWLIRRLAEPTEAE